MNADDDHDTNGGLNDAPDAEASYYDMAFGGAGRDVLIANTGGDRLIDWAGEFNTYLVPFSAFGAFTISRALPPNLFEFLYDLSAADGADPTRAAETGSDPERNGEPDGELGLVVQKDPGWHAQTGAPADVQPGNIPGGPRDVVRSATFNLGTAEGFAADSGTWTLTGGRLEVEPEVLGGDAVSVFYVDEVLPSYFEMRATIQGGKPIAGYKSNAFLIFDYQSPTDFKFAGVNISIDKLQIGHRDATGWHVDVQSSGRLKPNTDYNMLLAMNGGAVTLVVNNQDVLTHVFAPRLDPDGFAYGLNAGMVGIGANNSISRIDNVAVQILPREVTLVHEEDFSDGVADMFSGDRVGQWQVIDGRLVADTTIDDGQSRFYNKVFIDSDLEIGAGYVGTIEFNVQSENLAGVVFDRYSTADYKFVLLSSWGQVYVGHHSTRDFQFDATASFAHEPGEDHDVKVTIAGTTVSVYIDGKAVLSYAYNALLVDGKLGLMSWGLDEEPSSSFDDVRLSTSNPDYLDESAGEALLAAHEADVADTPAPLTDDELVAIFDAALLQLFDADLISGEQFAALMDVDLVVVDLEGLTLGLATAATLYIDIDAAGHGWFVDATPQDSSEFYLDVDSDHLIASSDSEAYGQIDLLTVVMHELGHLLGIDHSDSGLMAETLDAGTRVALSEADATESFETYLPIAYSPPATNDDDDADIIDVQHPGAFAFQASKVLKFLQDFL